MTHEETDSTDQPNELQVLVKSLRRLVGLGGFLFGLASLCLSAGVSWGITSNRSADQERRLTAVENVQRNDHDTLTDVARDVKWICEQLGKR